MRWYAAYPLWLRQLKQMMAADAVAVAQSSTQPPHRSPLVADWIALPFVQSQGFLSEARELSAECAAIAGMPFDTPGTTMLMGIASV